jgi:hypothetical protein
MSDSWEAFSAALHEESAALARVHEAGLRMTEALIHNVPAEITLADRGLDGARKAFQASSSKRRGMMVRGFGKMTLRQVCRYAPRRLAPTLGQRLYELTTLSISVKITSGNNKSLIAAGMERLIKITTAMQKAANAEPQTYKRRGFIPPPTNSVLLSSRA